MKPKQSALVLKDPLMVRNARIQSHGHKLILEILIFFVVFLISGIIETMVVTLPTAIGLFQTEAFHQMMEQAQNGTFDYSTYIDNMQLMMEQMPDWVSVITLFSTAAIILTVLIYCTKIEKRKLSTLGLTKKHCISEYLIGLGVGLFMFILVWGLNLLLGGATLEGVIFQPNMLVFLIFSLLGYMVQGASEEILCRGYFCNSVARWMPLWVGLIVNSIAFALLHLGNPGISPLALLNLFLFGVFMTIYMIRRGNLWGACAIHSIWNFTQGNIFGLQVSGTASTKSFLRTVQTKDMALWNGGEFGPEGGLCVTFVLIAAILIVWLFCKNRDLGQTAEPVSETAQLTCQR